MAEINAVRPPAPFRDAPWKAVELPPEVLRVITMLSEEEGQLLYWLARDYAEGTGAVCDLGCFAGGSTARLAAGLVANPRTGGKPLEVHAYDHFSIQEAQKARYLYPAGIAPFEGTDMLAAVRTLLAPWAEGLQLHAGDLRQSALPEGPIEILFIDAAKTPETTDVIAHRFMPALIPGRSLVIHQDYQHWRQPWVPAQMELLSDCFELVAWCRQGTAVFRCTRAVDSAALAGAMTHPLSDADLTRLVRDAIRRFPTRPQRKRLACTLLAIEDNPGQRLSYRFENKGFSAERVASVLAGL